MVIETFDTHAYILDLIAKGIPDVQAEVFASMKLDIVRLANRMEERFIAVDRRFDAMDRRFDTVDQRFDLFEKKLDAKIDEKTANLRAEMIKWMFGFFVTQLAATFTMIRFLS